MPYSFGYGVKDYESYNDFGHQEASDGKTVTGSYHVKLPDGRLQTVNYKADEYGYVADVQYKGDVKHDAYKPSYNPTSHPKIVYPEPSYPKASYSEPSYSKSVYPQPSHSKTYSEPSYSKPAYTQPSYPKSTYAEPSYPKYAYPSDTKAAYTKPSYTSYDEPYYTSYNKPSNAYSKTSDYGY